MCPIPLESPCPDCGHLGITIDTREADAVCTYCGLVRAGHLMCEQAEHRSFAGDNQEHHPPDVASRVGPQVAQADGRVMLAPLKIAKNDRLNKLNAMCAGRDTTPQVSDSFKASVEALCMPEAVVADAVSMYRSTRRSFGALTKAKQSALEAVCVFYAGKAALAAIGQRSKEQVCTAFQVPLTLFWQMNKAFADAAVNRPWHGLVTEVELAPAMLPGWLRQLGPEWSLWQRMEMEKKVKELYRRHYRRIGHLEEGGVLAALLWLVHKDFKRTEVKLSKGKLAEVAGVTLTTINNAIQLIERARGRAAARPGSCSAAGSSDA